MLIINTLQSIIVNVVMVIIVIIVLVVNIVIIVLVVIIVNVVMVVIIVIIVMVVNIVMVAIVMVVMVAVVMVVINVMVVIVVINVIVVIIVIIVLVVMVVIVATRGEMYIYLLAVPTMLCFRLARPLVLLLCRSFPTLLSKTLPSDASRSNLKKDRLLSNFSNIPSSPTSSALFTHPKILFIHL